FPRSVLLLFPFPFLFFSPLLLLFLSFLLSPSFLPLLLLSLSFFPLFPLPFPPFFFSLVLPPSPPSLSLSFPLLFLLFPYYYLPLSLLISLYTILSFPLSSISSFHS
ncbi:hypothetical protein, partial [Klebsiella pneumoniae]|uniref:hypothetical protein n=1 Tax=Klebsiella pneumoniae TaxID=573 RepID=UPI0019635090